jgi:beta-barrel assembly-enhancing protease
MGLLEPSNNCQKALHAMNTRSLHRRPILIGILFALVIAAGIGCTFVHNVAHKMGPGTEKFVDDISSTQDARRLGEADEDELGKSVAILITNRYEPTYNQRLVEYVNLVGFTLVSASTKPDRHYVFGVLDTDDIGAYSGPNGYVMVTRGALQSMNDEAELAGVLAHELTHVIDQHGLAAARTAAQKAGWMDATKMLVPIAKVTDFIDNSVDAVTRSGYDRPQEADADAGAVKLLIAAGYDPRSYARYLAHVAELQQAAAPPPATQPGTVGTTYKQIMATHPNIHDRFEAVTREIADAGPTAAGGATMPDRFKSYVTQ